MAPEVNGAVETAHRDGILTAASLMVSGAAAADAVERARRLPTLRVGLHVVLVEGLPTLPPERLPDLVDRDGRFRTDMAAMGLELIVRPAVRRQLAAEVEAQFAAFAATGLPLDHVNAHRHFHLHPTIARAIIAAGRRHGLRALRVPVERRATLRQAEPQSRGPARFESWIVAPWARLLARAARRAGLRTPDSVFGLDWSGAMTAARLTGLIEHLPAGQTEIYLHPATRDDFTGHAPGYRYADELAALISPSAIAAARRPDIRLGGFSDF
jgi:hopanoid biosynthesis associated protein HpnK